MRWLLLTLTIIFGELVLSKDVYAEGEFDQIFRDTARLQSEFRNCLSSKIVELGANNHESIELVLRGASAACRPTEMDLRNLYARTPLSTSDVEGLMRRDQQSGEDAGVSSLLIARAKKQ